MKPSTTNVVITSIASGLVLGLALMFVVWGVNINKGIDAPGNLSIAFGIGLASGFIIAALFWVKSSAPKKEPVVKSTMQKEQAQIVRPQLTVIQDADTSYPSGSFDLPENVRVEDMIELAHQIIDLKKDFSHAALAGPGKPFSRPKYESMRGYCFERKWIRWNSTKEGGKTQGIGLRKYGVDAFNQLLSPYPASVFRLYGKELVERPHTHTRAHRDQLWE